MRISEYYENTDKAIEFYRSEGVLTELDGEQDPEEIAKSIRSTLGISERDALPVPTGN